MTLRLRLAQLKLSPATMAALRDRVITTLEEPDDDEYLKVCAQAPLCACIFRGAHPAALVVICPAYACHRTLWRRAADTALYDKRHCVATSLISTIEPDFTLRCLMWYFILEQRNLMSSRWVRVTT